MRGRGLEPASGAGATRSRADKVFLDESGKQIEWHYWLDPDGTLDGGKIVFPGTTSRVDLTDQDQERCTP